jgi:hypothetical protein
MTRRTCQHTGRKLPDHHSCSLLCRDFPSCLPPPSSALVSSVRAAQERGDAAHQEAVMDALIELHAAIVEGQRRRS